MSEDRDRRKHHGDQADLAEVTRVNGPFEADLIKNFLASHGITAVILGRTAPFVYPLTVDGMAEFRVLVQQSDAEKARELITAMPAPDDDPEPEKPA